MPAAADSIGRRRYRFSRHPQRLSMFSNLGFSELAMILVICMVLFGAKRIPEIGSSIGKGIREFKKGVSDIQDSTRTAMLDERAPVAAAAHDTMVEPRRLL